MCESCELVDTCLTTIRHELAILVDDFRGLEATGPLQAHCLCLDIEVHQGVLVQVELLHE